MIFWSVLFFCYLKSCLFLAFFVFESVIIRIQDASTLVREDCRWRGRERRESKREREREIQREIGREREGEGSVNFV